ncbi:MAG: hypothetical protein KDI44_02105 [Thiothrix sp.]|nr:hypothetical protein [Thiothrix sp.]HPQ97730.1 hypothetical protein [Thiolinea sp.]
MNEEYGSLSDQLRSVIRQMQKIQKGIAGSQQPASMHELDQLVRLGQEYAGITNRLAELERETRRQDA